MERELKIAVLIDAENISSKYAGIILQEAASLGNVIYKRIYGNWTTSQLSSWKKVMLENAIQPIQQYSNTVGKNSSDSALIIDAMDLLYQHKLDAFCIVSSDSDFTRLATRLRESEMYVLGMGERKTPRSFISACNKFSYLDLLYKANKDDKAKKERSAKGSKQKKKADQAKTDQSKRDQEAKRRNVDVLSGRAEAAKGLPEGEPAAEAEVESAENAEAAENTFGEGSDIIIVQNTLLQIAEELSGDDGFILSSSLGGYVSKRLPDFDVRNFGFKKFVPFVESLHVFETKTAKTDENGGRVVYFRPISE